MCTPKAFMHVDDIIVCLTNSKWRYIKNYSSRTIYHSEICFSIIDTKHIHNHPTPNIWYEWFHRNKSRRDTQRFKCQIQVVIISIDMKSNPMLTHDISKWQCIYIEEFGIRKISLWYTTRTFSCWGGNSIYQNFLWPVWQVRIFLRSGISMASFMRSYLISFSPPPIPSKGSWVSLIPSPKSLFHPFWKYSPKCLTIFLFNDFTMNVLPILCTFKCMFLDLEQTNVIWKADLKSRSERH